MRRGECGYALITVLAMMILIISVWLANKLPGTNQTLAEQGAIAQRQAARESLEAAKARLIELALGNVKTPGAFPCPDYLNNGQGSYTCTTDPAPYSIKPPGRNPYVIGPGADQIYNMQPPLMQTTRNGEKECLWYVASPAFGEWVRNELRLPNPPADRPGRGQLNPDATPNLYHNGSPVVAILIAPGDAIGTQNRSAAIAPSYCKGGNYEAYLESYTPPMPATSQSANYTDFRGLTARNKKTSNCQLQSSIDPQSDIENSGECNNDVVLAISKDELMRPLAREVLLRLSQEDLEDKYGEILIPSAIPGLLSILHDQTSATLEAIRAKLGQELDPQTNLSDPTLPYVFDSFLFGKNNLTRLALPSDCSNSVGIGSKYDARPLWLCSNGWYRYIDFDADAQTLSISLNKGTSSAYRCELPLAKSPKEVVCH